MIVACSLETTGDAQLGPTCHAVYCNVVSVTMYAYVCVLCVCVYACMHVCVCAVSVCQCVCAHAHYFILGILVVP